MDDYSHPLSDVPTDYSAGYPSVGTTSLLKSPGKPSKLAVIPTGSILAIRFLGDHGKVKDAAANFASDGTSYLPKPEWIVNAVNTPLTYTKGKRIRLNVVVKVSPIGEFYKLVGDGGLDYLRFEKDGLFSTGLKQNVFSLSAKSRLPGHITHIHRPIRWYAQGNGWRLELGKSGPHHIFVLWDKPIEKSSRGYQNTMTYKRIELLTSRKVAGGKGTIDQIAKAVRNYLNSKVVSTVQWKSPDPSYSKSSDFWSILDGGAQAQCFEGSNLMELMLGVLGVPAVQKHLHGGTTPADIAKYLAHGPKIPGLQSRTCYYHKNTEQLHLLYGSRFQEGQGCCEVLNKLYAVFVRGNIVGVASGKLSVAHHVLQQLEQVWKPISNNKFMVWAHAYKDAKGKEWVVECLAPAKKGVQGPPAPPVPPVPP